MSDDSEHAYSFQLTDLYFDADLDNYEFRLLAHYKRMGTCVESLETTARRCHMSPSQVSVKRRTLAAKGFIRINAGQIDIVDLTLDQLSAWLKESDIKTWLETTCIYCGSGNGDECPDHVIPKSRGGSNEKSNIVPACRSCNTKKGAQTPMEWIDISNDEFYFGSPRHVTLMQARKEG